MGIQAVSVTGAYKSGWKWKCTPMDLMRAPHDPCTSEEVGLHMDLGMVREFENNFECQYFF